MTVQEIVDELSKYDPMAQVLIRINDRELKSADTVREPDGSGGGCVYIA
jgi:hypothetical protein